MLTYMAPLMCLGGRCVSIKFPKICLYSFSERGLPKLYNFLGPTKPGLIPDCIRTCPLSSSCFTWKKGTTFLRKTFPVFLCCLFLYCILSEHHVPPIHNTGAAILTLTWAIVWLKFISSKRLPASGRQGPSLPSLVMYPQHLPGCLVHGQSPTNVA